MQIPVPVNIRNYVAYPPEYFSEVTQYIPASDTANLTTSQGYFNN